MSESSRNYYLAAIIGEIERIGSFITDQTLETYRSDIKAQYEVERALLNISEAVRKLEKFERRLTPDFELSSIAEHVDWSAIKGIGNILRHDYDNISVDKIWTVVSQHLSVLEDACRSALSDA